MPIAPSAAAFVLVVASALPAAPPVEPAAAKSLPTPPLAVLEEQGQEWEKKEQGEGFHLRKWL